MLSYMATDSIKDTSQHSLEWPKQWCWLW